jgi:nucleotide-binding universal stress UspA family protein
MPYAARILVPTDFSPLSTVALEHAIALASLCRASIHLMHVQADAGKDVDIEAARRLAGLVSRCHAEGIVVTSQMCAGQPAAAIVEAAADRAVDLIVLGTHGRHGVAHLMLGSVAEHVVRTAPCPVLTVRGHVPERVQRPAEAAWGLLPG